MHYLLQDVGLRLSFELQDLILFIAQCNGLFLGNVAQYAANQTS